MRKHGGHCHVHCHHARHCGGGLGEKRHHMLSSYANIVHWVDRGIQIVILQVLLELGISYHNLLFLN